MLSALTQDPLTNKKLQSSKKNIATHNPLHSAPKRAQKMIEEAVVHSHKLIRIYIYFLLVIHRAPESGESVRGGVILNEYKIEPASASIPRVAMK
jgi:hypothetical protein